MSTTTQNLTEQWLAALTQSSRAVYQPSIGHFQTFLQTQTLYPNIHNPDDFLKAILEDNKRELLERQRPGRKIMKAYIQYLTETRCKHSGKTLTPKTIRTYMGTIQSLGQYWEIPVSTQYAELPPPVVTYNKYPWSIAEIGKFICSMKDPMYQCLGVWFLQSALSNWDMLHLTYGQVRKQLEEKTAPLCLSLVRHKTRRYSATFRTFIGAQGIQYFLQYVEQNDLHLGDDDVLFSVSDNAIEGYFSRRAKKFLPQGYAERNPCCPSSLRTAFKTLLSDAECPSHWSEYWMGHNLTGDLQKTYTNKSDASWRESYRRYEPALTFQYTS